MSHKAIEIETVLQVEEGKAPTEVQSLDDLFTEAICKELLVSPELLKKDYSKALNKKIATSPRTFYENQFAKETGFQIDMLKFRS